MCPWAMSVTLDFQGQIFKKLCPCSGVAVWYGTKAVWVDRRSGRHHKFSKYQKNYCLPPSGSLCLECTLLRTAFKRRTIWLHYALCYVNKSRWLFAIHSFEMRPWSWVCYKTFPLISIHFRETEFVQHRIFARVVIDHHHCIICSLGAG